MKFTPDEENTFSTLKRLLREVKVPVSNSTLKQSILQQNNSNTIFGFSEILNSINVSNLAVRLDSEQLQAIPCPAIAFFEMGTFVTILNCENHQISWYHNTFGEINESIEHFAEKWQGVTLLVEPREESGEIGYRKRRIAEIYNICRWPLSLLMIFIAIIYYIKPTDSQYYILWITKSIGLIIASLLTGYSLGFNSTLINKLCNISSKSKCSNVLRSKEADVFNIISWSEIGLLYFSGGLISMLIQPPSLKLLSSLAFLSPIFIIWSLYFQGIKIKKWCPLCVIILVILILEFYLYRQINIPYGFEIRQIYIFIIPTICWVLIRPYVKKIIEFDSIYNNLQKIKFDDDFLYSWYNFKAYLPPLPLSMDTIVLGNKNSDNRIIAIINPVCKSCESIYRILKELEEHAKIDIVFAITLNYNDEETRIASAILSQPTNKERVKMLNEFFSMAKNNINVAYEQDSYNILREHSRWLRLANITEVPKVYINNNLIPDIYRAEEITKIFKTITNLGFANQPK